MPEAEADAEGALAADPAPEAACLGKTCLKPLLVNPFPASMTNANWSPASANMSENHVPAGAGAAGSGTASPGVASRFLARLSVTVELVVVLVEGEVALMAEAAEAMEERQYSPFKALLEQMAFLNCGSDFLDQRI